MPNGRGAIDCCYCVSFRCHNPTWEGADAAHEPGTCGLHRAALPDTTASGLQRVCRDFRPNGWLARDSEATAEERMAWFPVALTPGVLYGFEYNWPPGVHPIADLGSAEAAGRE